MQQSLHQMKVALRVLAALTEKQYPDPDSLAELRRLAPDVSLPADELACEVIQRAMKRRAEVQAQLKNATGNAGA